MNHLLTLHTGQTKGPRSREGSLASQFYNLQQESMVDFTRISGKVEEDIDTSVLQNQDIRYFYHLCMGVQKGFQYLLGTFGQRKIPLPSQVHEARWINTASAIMRLYIQSEDPSEPLVRLVSIIVQWYGPLMFAIKTNPHIVNGAIHIYNSIELARDCMTSEEFDVFKKYSQINGYMAHSESILLAMVNDKNDRIRQKAVEKIISLRKNVPSEEVRKFKIPTINFKAKNYIEMVGFDEITSPPPLLGDFSDEDLAYGANGVFELPVEAIPCHSINNERLVQASAQAVKYPVGEDRVHERLLNNRASQLKIPTNFNKSHFSGVPKN